MSHHGGIDMKVDSIVVYRSFVSALRKIKDPAERCKAYDAMFDYGLDHIETELDDGAGIALELIKPLLDQQYQKKMTNRANGKRGGRPSGEAVISDEELDVKTENNPEETEKNRTETEKNRKKPNHNPNVNVNDNANVNVNGNNTSRFVKPNVEEVREYCISRNNSVDPEEFVDFYTSKNWMVGKNKMVDWKACVRTWEKYSKNSKQSYDELPVYDASKNKSLSNEELNELLALRGKA